MTTSKVWLSVGSSTGTLDSTNGLVKTDYAVAGRTANHYTTVDSDSYECFAWAGLSSPNIPHGTRPKFSISSATISNIGDVSLQSYTFPVTGGGTLASTLNKKSFVVNYHHTWYHKSYGTGVQQQYWEFWAQQPSGTPNSGTYYKNYTNWEAIPEDSVHYNSGNVSYQKTGSGVVGGATDTITSATLYTEVDWLTYTLNSNGQFSTTDGLDITATYYYDNSYEVNLIAIDGVGGDTIEPMTIDTAFAVGEEGILIVKFGQGNLEANTTHTPTANNRVGFDDNRLYNYLEDDYWLGEYVAYPASIDLVQRFSQDSALACLGGRALYSANVSVSIGNTLTAFEGKVLIEEPFTQTPSTASTFETLIGNLTISTTTVATVDTNLTGLSNLSIEAASEELAIDLAQTVLGGRLLAADITIASALDTYTQYFEGDYAAEDYVQGQGTSYDLFRGTTCSNSILTELTSTSTVIQNGTTTTNFEFSQTVDGIVEQIAEANISADATITGQPGYLLSTGTLTYGAEVEANILQYLTGGTGVIIGSVQTNVTADTALSSQSQVDVLAETALLIETATTNLSGFALSADSSLAGEFDVLAEPSSVLLTGSDMNFTTNWNILAGLAIYGTTDVDLFAMSMSYQASSRIVKSDEYYTYLVPSETRQLWIDARDTQLEVASEQRINIVMRESRDIAIDTNTRTLKVNLAPARLEGFRIRRTEEWL